MCDFFLLGLPGLVQAYQTCIQSVQLYGPTNISPIISHVAHFAQQAAQTPTAAVSNMHNFLSDLWHLCPEMHAMAKMAQLAKNRQPLTI